MISRFIRFAACCLLITPPAAAQTSLRIAAASDLQSVLPALTARFERETHQTVDVSFGSSGNFFAQLQNGAPFDLFFSADVNYPRQLESSRLTVPGTLVEYARGRIVLWSRNDANLDLSRGLAILAEPRVRRIAIANPEHAPYGRAAVAALQHEQLYDRVRSKFVLGENISQAAQFVQSGNADAGLIALSLALAPAMRSTGHYVDIPESYHPPIEQAAVVLSGSRRPDVARQFLTFLERPDNQQTLKDAGFTPPSRGR
ncbi:MAG TPA: molybdate ABC transporter substrate-binding protein [Vicinamibacterales bacterium]|nr:molybdate ABC transporter substrate-binding protein [Vicinamibacterales bacterium]